MTRLGLLVAILTAGTALAAAPKVELVVVRSLDDKVCDYFKTHYEVAPITWQSLPSTPEADNARAAFDFENTGTPVQVHRREEKDYVFGGTYFLTAPQGFTVPRDWFEQIDLSKVGAQPPAPMRMYVQEDLNTTAEIAQFNKRNYVRTVPIREDINLVMILEPKDGKLHELCRYEARQ